MDLIVFDCETEAIQGNPLLKPPKMVGYAVMAPGVEPTYLAWGHPTENNCTYAQAREYAKRLRDSGIPWLCHHAPFDLTVLDDSLSLPWLFHNGGWKRVHDTVYLLFLVDPYAPTLSLKPSAARHLGLPPTEQDELKAWILNHVRGATEANWGGFISLAPGGLVGKYAIGDIVRTKLLFDKLYAKVIADGMEAAYDRERALMPRLVAATQKGIRVDRDGLHHAVGLYEDSLARADRHLAARLDLSVDELHSDDKLADGLERCGAVTTWVRTATGKRSMSKENLRIVHPEIKALMAYRGAVSTCLQTFMRPWLTLSEEDGRIHPNWNQVRQAKGENGSKGTRTGRLSSDEPNFQNVPNEFKDKKGVKLIVPQDCLPYPIMRSYCLPEEGHLWLKRDFSSQEIRILAHFEDGSLCEAYRANPALDPHQMAMELVNALVGILYSRHIIKITGFSIIYGSGATGLGGQLEVPTADAKNIRYSYLGAMPGVKELMDDVQQRGKAGQPIRTWGGRLYYVEPSRTIKWVDEWGNERERFTDFAYKLLNYLIQGSAADQTKESINDWFENKKWEAIFLATVHDEINISAPAEDWESHMATLRECMNRDRFDVPFLSEGFVGPNWSDLKAVA